ncbi:MAG: class I SAM-dependent methyltransferase [Oscillatoriales cyanobacterium]|nr:MAG: class I SAM-dependent methyltransferase [Oscillatoriales cyanobacterium]
MTDPSDAHPPAHLSRDDIRRLRDRALADDHPADWFDPLYVAANGQSDQIPWALEGAHPALKSWIAERSLADIFHLPKAKALVVGCGLGDDAEAIAQLGFQVTAFDVSPCAIGWCQERFETSRVNYCTADLFHLDAAWSGRFDLVFECRTLQALPLSVREQAIDAVVAPVAPGGRLVVVTHTRPTEDAPEGPPWPLSPAELDRFTQHHALTLTWEREFASLEMPPRRCLEFVRVGAS